MTWREIVNCPECGKDNKCAMERGLPPYACWCMDKDIPRELVDKYDPNWGCICENCVDNYVKEKSNEQPDT